MGKLEAILSLPKGGDAGNLSNYNPISIFLTAVKLFKCLFCCQNEYFLVYKYICVLYNINSTFELLVDIFTIGGKS